MRCKVVFALELLGSCNYSEDIKKAITQAYDLITEYSKTRHKIKKLIKDSELSDSPSKNQGKPVDLL